jgi:hypothetical protein
MGFPPLKFDLLLAHSNSRNIIGDGQAISLAGRPSGDSDEGEFISKIACLVKKFVS